MLISDNFRKKLIFKIATAPIIYIPHYHYGYVDSVLTSIFLSDANSRQNVFGLSHEHILECAYDKGSVDIDSKLPGACAKDLKFQDILKRIIENRKFTFTDSENKSHPRDIKIVVCKNPYNLFVDARQNASLNQGLLQTFASQYERGVYDRCTTIILVDPHPVVDLPLEIRNIVSVVDVPVPTIDDIKKIVSALQVSPQLDSTPGKIDRLRDSLARNLQGLQFYEIEQVLRTSLFRSNGRLQFSTLEYAIEEKREIVKKSGIIEVIDTNVSLEDVGGMDLLLKDIEREAVLFQNLDDVIRYGIQLPKGILIMGMPGCGKSMMAKAIAKKFGVSLLRLDVSRLMGQYVGQSEQNMRSALATAEAAHPCVLWIDEIEKAFHGANASSGGDNDMLVMRMMGYFLTWMQERETAVYIVATANDVMRPEFMRKGRFDQVYFVDFPGKADVSHILSNKLNPFRLISLFDLSNIGLNEIDSLAELMSGFTGSEIEGVVKDVISSKFKNCLDKRLDRETPLDTITLQKNDFEKVIKEQQSSVLSKQDNPSIDRIRALKMQYKFKDSSSVPYSDNSEISELKDKFRKLTKQLEIKRLKEEIDKLDKENTKHQ